MAIIRVAVCGVNGVLGRNALCGSCSVKGSYCSAGADVSCVHRASISPPQSKLPQALDDGVVVEARERPGNDWPKNWVFRAKDDSLPAHHLCMSAWALLKAGVLRIGSAYGQHTLKRRGEGL